MFPDDPSVPVQKYGDRQSDCTECPCYAVVLPDRKGESVGLYELLYMLVIALHKDGGEADALPGKSEISPLKFGGLPPALRSPVGADIDHRRPAGSGLV